MKKFILLLCLLLLLCFFGAASAQVKARLNKTKYIVAPSENALLTVASQTTCPLHIGDSQLLLSIENSRDFVFLYELRNQGNKPIRDFTIVYWTTEGGGTISDNRLDGQLLLPSQKIPIKEETETRTILPLTDLLREKLQLGVSMKIVVVLMVERIEFADGTVYSDEKTSEALHQYLEEQGNDRN